jgi:hypothetical protein
VLPRSVRESRIVLLASFFPSPLTQGMLRCAVLWCVLCAVCRPLPTRPLRGQWLFCTPCSSQGQGTGCMALSSRSRRALTSRHMRQLSTARMSCSKVRPHACFLCVCYCPTDALQAGVSVCTSTASIAIETDCCCAANRTHPAVQRLATVNASHAKPRQTVHKTLSPMQVASSATSLATKPTCSSGSLRTRPSL